MKTEVINPNVSNFIKSLRDIGYTFEIAVADVLDNSISANSSNIKIYTVPKPEIIFCMLDDGDGMSNNELVEAMRLSTKDPEGYRQENDLGRFGLGLKTASFSQCKRLTVISKKNGIASIKQWDLEYISNANKWLLITPDIDTITNLPLLEDLKKQDHGTLVVWENLDRYEYEKDNFSDRIDKLSKYLSLVFHRFLEGTKNFKKLKISINNSQLKPFNPFNISNPATQQLATEKIKLYDSIITIQPFILPHHSKVSQQEYDKYATEKGYTSSQGFYLYRSDRLLIYGTWLGIHKSVDAHKLVRIKIDIPNNQDRYWGIDVKKSSANPSLEIKRNLRRIISQITEKSSRVYTGRGKKIYDKTTKRFWEIKPCEAGFRFALNQEHPILKKLTNSLETRQLELLNIYLKGIQSYLPLDAIQAQLQQNPHKIKQETVLTKEEIIMLAKKLKSSCLDKDYINELLKTELFKNHKELLQDE